MFLIYIGCAWMVGCGMMALSGLIWKNHKRRSERIRELEAENRHLNSVLEFYENIAESDRAFDVSSGMRVHHDAIRRTRVG